MFIPAGKKIYLTSGGSYYLDAALASGSYPGFVKIPMYLGEDLQLKTSSQYAQPFQSMQEGAVNLGLATQTASALLGAGANKLGIDSVGKMASKFSNTTFQNQNSAFQIWKYSDPLSFSFTVKFYMGIADYYDAKLEVYYPTLRLMEIVLPEIVSGSKLMVAPGPTITDFVNSFKENKIESYGESFSVFIGNVVKLQDIIIKDVEATFNHEVDSAGYPISSTVRISIETQKVGTRNMIRNMLAPTQSLNNRVYEEQEAAKAEAEQAAMNQWAQALLGIGT